MNNNKLITLNIFSLFLFLSSILNAKSNINEVCFFNYIEFEVLHLNCLKNSPAIKSIKSNFLRFYDLKKTCSECVDMFPEASTYSYLYKRDYLALAMGEHDFGGYFAFIIFKNDPLIYDVWLYEIDKGFFQIREFKPEEPHIKIRNKMQELAQDLKFSKYWTNAFE